MRRYIKVIKVTPRNNTCKEFIAELAVILSPVKFRRDVAFRIYPLIHMIWWNEIDVSNPERTLAVSLLSNWDSMEAAERLIRAWWIKHAIWPDEDKLRAVLTDADAATLEKRQAFRLQTQILKEENEASKTKALVLELLSLQPGMTPTQVSEALGITRSAANMQLKRLVDNGGVVTRSKGRYSLPS